MKKILPLIGLLLSLNAAFGQPLTQPFVSQDLPANNSNAFRTDPTTGEWLSAAEKLITVNESSFKKVACSHTFYVANRTQRIGFVITPTGYKTYPLIFSGQKDNAPAWQQSLSFSEIKRGGTHMLAGNTYSIAWDKTTLYFNHPGFSIQYINNEKGMRQNFIIAEKPAGTGNLELLLKTGGDLSASVSNNGLQFKDKAGNIKLLYTDLKVWDADNNIMDAGMELRNDNTVAIIVNDSNAKYPVTIDPINKTPEWASSADGILPNLVGQLSVDAAYGFSVAGLGDVNGDGYDDVAIGAPAMVDIISGTGTLASVGAVFIYYGSPTGLSATPAAILQPTTAVAGALFGYSVAGGDINNDGKADIIVGAPMDMVSVSVGGGGTASGTVGKVYVYNGATLSTGASPLLTLQLNGNGILENGVNLSVNALFGFSVAVTEDMNNDNRKDIIVGAPTYAGIKTGILGNSILDVQSGGAFVFLSNGAGNPSLVKLKPIQTGILGLPILQTNINGLLFGYSVDGLGDYNGDGYPDVIASAPAGVNMGSVSALLNGKLLQGSATVYYGTGSGVDANPGATLTATSDGLLSNIVGSISNVANMFGVSLRGVKSAFGVRNGNVLIGAPLGGALMNVLGLQLKTGTVSLFKKKATSPSGNVIPDQVLSSPRNNNNILEVIQSNLLFGYSIDNVYDINCDGIDDLIVGEPASTGVQLVNANVSGGAAYIYFGNADGTYQTTPYWTLTATTDAFLGINATSLIGYSVAGAGHVWGIGHNSKALVGSPSKTLDFGAGVLNLGSTLNTIFNLTAGNNGAGKVNLFDIQGCGNSGALSVTLMNLNVTYNNGISHLTWKTAQEANSSHFDIEHSIDGVLFNYTGSINAAGFSNTGINYKFDDVKVNSGMNYYRLKMTDKDGRFVYSNIVTVTVNIKGTFITAVYPAPFTDKVNVSVSAEGEGLANIRMIDNTGKLVSSCQSMVHKGANTIVIDNLYSLSKGTYIIQVKVGDVIKNVQLIK